MLWIEILILFIIIASAIEGFRRGFIHKTIDLILVVASYVLALKYFNFFANLFVHWGLSISWSKPAGFFALWAIAQAVFTCVLFLFNRFFFKSSRKNLTNKVLGLMPGFAQGILTITIVLMVVLALPIANSAKDTLSAAKISGSMIKLGARFEGQLKNIFGQAESVTGNIESPDQEITYLDFKTSQFDVDKKSEEKMLELVNADRAAHNLEPLTLDSKLSDVARAHSIDMLENGYFSHVNLSGKNPFQRLTDKGISYGVAGENIAISPTAQMAEVGFMNSQKHRDNILNPKFKKIGIGIVVTKNYGRSITQEFTD